MLTEFHIIRGWIWCTMWRYSLKSWRERSPRLDIRTFSLARKLLWRSIWLRLESRSACSTTHFTAYAQLLAVLCCWHIL